MKRFIMMALVAVIALCFTAPASAVEVNMSGKWENAFQWSDNTNLFDETVDATSEDDFFAYQRVRFYWEAVASENVRGVFGLQSTMDYGRSAGANQSSLGSDAVGITREDTYIDFNWPNTALRVRMGFWYLEPPTNFGAPVWNDDVAGISASYAFNDMVSMVAFWARLYDENITGDAGDEASEEVDAFGLILPVAGDGFNFTPWVIYAAHGGNTTGFAGASTPVRQGLGALNATRLDDDVRVWWAGAQFSLNMFDPFIFYADLIYGDQSGAQEQNDRSGWWFDLAMDYTGFDMVTPRLFFAWGSGDDEDVQDGSERLPTLGGESCGCGITSFGLDGSAGWRTADSVLIGGGYGFWVLGGSLVDFSFIESVSHTFTLAYGQGTNDSDLVEDALAGNAAWIGNAPTILTDEDSFWEINFDTKYQMYENMAAYLELGYVDVNLDDDVWTSAIGDEVESASKAAFIFQYSF